jgi:hypothetical protein
LASQFNEGRFIDLYRQHGKCWSWADYAEALGVPEQRVRTEVSRKRQRWVKEHDIWIPRRKVDSGLEFSSWPPLPAHVRDSHYARALVVAAVIRTYGLGGLEQWMMRYETTIRLIHSNDQVIRYYPDCERLCPDARNEYERVKDPSHLYIYESKASFLARLRGVDPV